MSSKKTTMAILFTGAYQIKSHVLVFEPASWLRFVMFIQQHKGRCHTSRTSTHQPNSKQQLCRRDSHFMCECVLVFGAVTPIEMYFFNRRAATLINWPNASAVKFGRRELNLRRPSAWEPFGEIQSAFFTI
jgi:hypothetical protein